MNKFNFLTFKENWMKFFTDKGFHIVCEWGPSDDGVPNEKDAGGARFVGCDPSLVVIVEFNYQRTDTETGGYIAIDFASQFNKVSQCPVYFDLLEKEETVWKAITMLMEVNPKISDWYGKIIKHRGGLEFDPPIYNIKEKQRTLK